MLDNQAFGAPFDEGLRKSETRETGGSADRNFGTAKIRGLGDFARCAYSAPPRCGTTSIPAFVLELAEARGFGFGLFLVLHLAPVGRPVGRG